MDLHNWMVCVITSVLVMLEASAQDRKSDWDNVVATARCRVQCLITYQMPDSSSPDLGLLGSRFRHTNVLNHCLNNAACNECLKPCSQPFVNLALCQRICEVSPGVTDTSCVQSCDYLYNISSQHPGTCLSTPPPSYGCLNTCISDLDCPTDRKCCLTSCGHTCIVPEQQFKGMPPVPDVPIIRERSKGGSIELKWQLPNDTGSDALLFIISSRYNVGQQHSESEMTPWQQVAQTPSETIVIKDIHPGSWYQFRVMAVNQHGSRGSSPPTPPYRLAREPEVPGPPVNLQEGDTIIKDNKIGVIIKWSKPKNTDLPISKYKIYWMRQVSTGSSSDVYTLPDQRRVIPADMEQFEIPDLEPDSQYLVQVQAISEYGSEKLKSDKASLIVNTFPLPNHSDIELQPLPPPPPIQDLTINEPFYLNGLLKANVTWQLPPNSRPGGDAVPGPGTSFIERVLVHWVPEVCITDDISTNRLSQTLSVSTQDQFYVMYDLRFDCRYKVKVQSVSRDGVTGPQIQLSFQTPKCQEAVIRGSVRPDCPTNLPRSPQEPVDLQYTILINKNNVTARLSWKAPHSDTPIQGYRIIYGQALLGDGSIEPQLDKTMAITKVLSSDELTLSLSGLQEQVTYVAQVQAFSTVGNGRLSYVQFTTPLLTYRPQPGGPPYQNLDRVEATTHLSRQSASSQGSTAGLNKPTDLQQQEYRDFTADHHSAAVGCTVPSLLTLCSIVIVISA